MMELDNSAIMLITIPLGSLIQKTGEAFKDEEDKRDLSEVCKDVFYLKYVKMCSI